MRELLMDRIPVTALALSIILFVYALVDLVVLPPPVARVGAAIALTLSVIYVVLSRLCAAKRIPGVHANSVVALMACGALVSSFSVMNLLGDGHLGVNLLLVVFTSSVFFTSRFWFLAVALAVTVGWSAFPWIRSSVSVHYSFAVYNGVAMAVVVHEFSRRSLRQVQVLKLQSQEQVAGIKRASRDAHRASTFFRAILDGTADPVYVKDTEGKYVMVNRAYLMQSEMRPERILGRTASDVFGAEEGKMLAAQEREVMSSGKGRTVEVTFRAIGKTYLTSISPYINEEGKIAGVIGIAQNITQRKRAEEARAEVVRQLEFAKSRAEEAAHAKSDFLACMSHEIRTPMNGVLGMSELLLDTRLDAEQREYVSAIHESAYGLLSVINDILDLSKIQAGKVVIEPVAFNVAEYVRATASFIASSARAKGLNFHVEIQPDLPGQVIADQIRLRQIVLNLLGNALKFTDAGRIKLRVFMMDGPRDQRRLRIEVEDTGIGIDPEKLPRIFEKFVQAHTSTTRHYGGTGLGLSISQQLAKLMGGEIGVRSEPGHGSTFWLDIPVRIPLGNGMEAVPSRQTGHPTEAAAADLTGLRVLLAEDNVVNQKLALALLRKAGCEVQLAVDGLEAVDMTLRENYHVVLMDCEMPRLNGFEATAEILRRVPTSSAPAIVALTAHAMEGYADKCFAAGMTGYLTKPLNRDLLVRTLARYAPPVAVAAAQDQQLN